MAKQAAEVMGHPMTARHPVEVFPPAAYIDDELLARGWSRSEWFSSLDPTPRQDVIDVLEGRPVTRRAAGVLSRCFGTSIRLWLNLDQVYREWLYIELERRGIMP